MDKNLIKKVSQGIFKCYKSAKDFPQSALSNLQQLYVDVQNECILFPIFGKLIPFHIRTIKNANKREDGKWSELRITFHVPEGVSKNVAAFADQVNLLVN